MSNIQAGFAIASIDGAASLLLTQVQFASAQTIEAVDLETALLSGARVANAVRLERSADGVTWVQVASAPLGDGVRNRRLAAAPGASVAARWWRVMLGAGTHGRALNIGQVVWWHAYGESATMRVHEFVFDDDERFDMVQTHRNLDVYDAEASAWVAALPVPHTDGLISRVDAPQSLDLMLLLHEAIPPHRIFRRADGDWESGPFVFSRLAQHRYDASYANSVNEVQSLRFSGFSAGETFNLTCEGATTSAIAYAAATLAADVQAALRALAPVGAAGVSVTSPASGELRLTFADKLSALDVAEVYGKSLSGAGVIFGATVTQGAPGGENVISATRGWPACGTFHQGRLVLSGMTSLPHGVLLSAVGDITDFDPGPARPDDAMFLSISGDRVARVRRLRSGPQGLELYTDAGEFRLDGRVIANGQPIAFVQVSQRGLQHFLPVLELDGASAFVQSGGQALRVARWSEAQANLVAENVSVVAGHLLRRPVGVAAWRATQYTDADLLMVLDADGGLSVFRSLADQKVAAWMPWQLGNVVAIGGQSRGRPLVIVRRQIAGDDVLRLEALDRTVQVDQAVVRQIDVATATLTGLEALEGVPVDVVVNGRHQASGLVANGELTLPEPVSGRVQIGRRVVVELETLPWRPSGEEAATFMKGQQRIARVDLVLGAACGQIEVRANDRAWAWRTPQQTFGRGAENRLDLSARKVALEGLPGWTEEARVWLTSINSDPFDVLAISASGRTA